MSYTFATLAQARAQLSQRLYDSGMVFWTSAELDVYLNEALRTWNSFSNFWRAEFTFPTVASQAWYDITDVGDAPNTLRPLTVTDVELFKQIEYMLLEPATGATWTGSLQFAITDILNAVARRRDEILSATGCYVTQQLISATAAGRKTLNDKTLDIRRVAWIPATGLGYSNTPLWPDDEWALQAYERDYTIAIQGVPSTYLQSTQPPLSFDVNITPAVASNYDVLSVEAGADLSVVAPSTFTIPDDFTWVMVWGALADLLGRESNAKDTTRAAYCEMRYVQGLALLLNSPALINMRIANLPMDVDSVQNADNYRPEWQAESTAQPDMAMTAGLNLIGMAPIPDAIYSLTASVVENAPIMEDDADYLEVGRDEYDVILDYAQHLAAFKMGGAEFLSTLPLLKRFYKQAALYNSKLAEMGEYIDAILDLSKLQEQTNPRFSSVTPATQASEQES